MTNKHEPPAQAQSPFDRPHPVVQLFREHPALVVTFAYLMASIFGLMFSYSFYREFGVNVVNFYQLTDFLMAVLREPVTLVLAGGGLMVAWLIRLAQRWEWRWMSKHRPRSWWMRAYKRIAEPAWGNPLSDAFILLAYAWVFIVVYGEWKADAIREGRGQTIRIEAGEGPQERVLLGASNTFLFLYDAEHDRVDVVPHESIERVVVGRKRRPAAEAPDAERPSPAPEPDQGRG